MKAKEIKCKNCGAHGNLYGSDHTNEYGPFSIVCNGCGTETLAWAHTREAWSQWKVDNK